MSIDKARKHKAGETWIQIRIAIERKSRYEAAALKAGLSLSAWMKGLADAASGSVEKPIPVLTVEEVTALPESGEWVKKPIEEVKFLTEIPVPNARREKMMADFVKKGGEK